jgi:hypothetical protein
MVSKKAICAITLGFVALASSLILYCGLFFIVFLLCVVSIGISILTLSEEDSTIDKALAVTGIVFAILAFLLGLSFFGVVECPRYLPDRCHIGNQNCEQFILQNNDSNSIIIKANNPFGIDTYIGGKETIRSDYFECQKSNLYIDANMDGLITDGTYCGIKPWGQDCLLGNSLFYLWSKNSSMMFVIDCVGASTLKKGDFVNAQIALQYYKVNTSPDLLNKEFIDIRTRVQ